MSDQKLLTTQDEVRTKRMFVLAQGMGHLYNILLAGVWTQDEYDAHVKPLTDEYAALAKERGTEKKKEVS